MDHQHHGQSSNGTVAYVAGLGASLGLVHVLTGPDHLSAIATLASGSRGRSQSFLLGIRWGFGHSLGIVLIFLIFVFVPEFNMDSLGKAGDIVVGVLMMLLGLFGVFRARRRYFATFKQGSIAVVSDEILEHDESKLLGSCVAAITEENEVVGNQKPDLARTCPRHETDRPDPATPYQKTKTIHAPLSDQDIENDSMSFQLDVDDGTVPEVKADDRTVSQKRSRFCTFSCTLCTRSMDLILAIVVGIFHGVAGAGGVLAVIPAISMKHDSNKAAAYLTMFFATSILAMGVLAALWGELSGRMGSTVLLEYRIAVAASLLSVAIGIIWEVLLGLDMLDTVFH